MTIDEYYQILAEVWASVDKNSKEEIHDYNEFKRQLRTQIEDKE